MSTTTTNLKRKKFKASNGEEINQDEELNENNNNNNNNGNNTITMSPEKKPKSKRKTKVVYSFEDSEDVDNNNNDKESTTVDEGENDEDSNNKKNKKKKQKIKDDGILSVPASSPPKNNKAKKAPATRKSKKAATAAPTNNTLLNFLNNTTTTTTTPTTDTTTTTTTSSSTENIILSPTSPQSSDDTNKPVHPFFDQVKKKVDIKKSSKKMQDSATTTAAIIKNNDAPLPDMFLSKKEKDELYTATQQEKFRLEIMKSNQDHEKLLSGKPIHPFFFTPQQSTSTSNTTLKATSTNTTPGSSSSSSSSSSIIIDLDTTTNTTTPSKYQIKNLLEFPIEEDQHIGWYNINNDETIKLPPSNKQLLDKFKRSKLKTSSIDYDNLIIDPNEIIPNFNKIINKIDKQLQSSSSSQQSQQSLSTSSQQVDQVDQEETTTTITPVIIEISKEEEEEEEKELKILNILFKFFNNELNENQNGGDDFEQFKLLYDKFKNNLINSSSGNCNSNLLSNKYYFSNDNSNSNNDNEQITSIFNELNQEVITFFDQWIKGWKNKLEKKVNKTSTGKIRKSKETALDDLLKSSILIVGPFGCGKSSMITVKSKKYNFTTLETNPSTKRSGKAIIELLGEATQSKALNIKTTTTPSNTTTPSSTPLSSQEPLSQEPSQLSQPIVKKGRGRKSLTTSTDNDSIGGEINKNLILFEEIDTLYEDDKGFNSSIVSLLNSTKVPIVMISNEINSSILKLVQDTGIITLYMSKPTNWSLSLYCCFILLKEKKYQYFLDSNNNSENNNNNNNTPLKSLDLLSFIINNNTDIRSCLNNLEFYIINQSNNNNNNTTNTTNNSNNVCLPLYMFENLFKKYNNNFLNLLFKSPLPSKLEEKEDKEKEQIEIENEEDVDDNFQLFEDKFKLVNNSIKDLDIDLYFNNYLEFIKHNNGNQDSSNNLTTTLDLDQIWELSDNFSTNDILLKRNFPYEPIVGDDEIFEILENSPTFISKQSSIHYDDYSYENYFPNSLLYNIPTCISIKSIDNYLLKINNQQQQQQQQNNNNFKFNTLKIENQIKTIKKTSIEDNIYKDIKDQISIKLNSNISSSKMFVEYTPWLIEICNSEEFRKLNNPKRGNRFTHYLEFNDTQISIILRYKIN